MGKGKIRESNMYVNEIIEYDIVLLVIGFCVYMCFEFYLMFIGYNIYGLCGFYWYWFSGWYIIYFNVSNDLFVECIVINIINRDIFVYCLYVKKVFV